MANFQKIPHKERMRHIKYRDQQWCKDEERHERELIKRMIAEKEAAMRQQEPGYSSEKERQYKEELEQVMKLMEEQRCSM